ncbi:MAG: phosphoribosylformylglycinamidine cyclo-ligase [Methanomicrobiales archaeon]|nr:phosphoribosylformylglycinamidine cyclo-ligase [Methanomicrobiales archaeon]
MEQDAYRDAGVDIDLEAAAVQSLISELTFRRTDKFGMTSEIGHFAGFIQFGRYVLALAVDGVGTKMLVADALRDWSTVGIDCIAMNVNDLYVMNLEPVAFVDYIATSALSKDQMRQIGIGLNEGAKQANLSIIGGETATLKGLVTGLDLAGACLGIQEKDKVISGSAITPGDCIVGIPSSGIHSNGLTLARRMVEEHGSYDEKLLSGETLGSALLKPTRIYAEVLAVCRETNVHGMCHITGGGLLNLNRLGTFGYTIDAPLPPQEIFAWIAQAGSISEQEMYRTFNMGMGYVFILPKEGFETVKRHYPDAQIVGQINHEPGITLRGNLFCQSGSGE